MILIFFCIDQQNGEGGSPSFEVKAACLGNHNFRLEVDGLAMNASLSDYSKVSGLSLQFMQFMCRFIH